MKKSFRLTALLLAVLMVLQCVAAAAEPEAKDIIDLPAGSEVVQTNDSDISPAEPVDIFIDTSLADGQVVHTPKQTLTVTATGNGIPLSADRLTVKLNGAAIAAVEGTYPLTLAPGDNTIEITAADAAKTIGVRFEIEVPAGWAHDALQFCVDQGILNGNENGDLQPTNKASRAQLAAMMVRLFAAEAEADISAYTDVQPAAWYYSEMARAVAMGIFEGSAGKLTPQKNITREQAFTVLARAFGVAAEDDSALDAFSDGNQVSAWAKSTVAGMLEAGYIHGNTDGTLNPKGYISRQELAQVLYNALDCITDDPAALTGRHNLYTGPIDALKGEIPGDLIVSCQCGENVDLSGFTAAGHLVLHLHGAKTASLDGGSDDLSVCSPVDLALRQPVKRLVCIHDGAAVHGSIEKAIVLADTVLDGTCNRATLHSGDLTVPEGARIERIDCASDATGSTVTVNGTVHALDAKPHSLTLNGSGSIDIVWQHRSDLKAECTVTELVDQIDAGLEGVTVIPGEAPLACYDTLDVTVTGKITGVDTDHVYGVPESGRKCTVTYRYNGKVVKTDDNFRLTEGAQLSCTVTTKMEYHVEKTEYVTATIAYDDEILTAQLPLINTGRWSDLHEAENVRTCRVLGIINYTTTLYAYSSLTSPIMTLPAGTDVTFLKFSEDGDVALVETKSGTRGWCSGYAVHVSWQVYHNDDVSYSTGTKEAFVNQYHNYSSPTKYLIWCNLYTTTVNIFEGSKGNWKLIKSCECVIGAPNSPTRPGVYSIYSHAYYWSFDSGSNLDVDRAYYASLFDGGIAFHTRLYYTGTSTMVNPALSAEISHGCVRCPDDIAEFIYYNCPIGTTVVVY